MRISLHSAFLEGGNPPPHFARIRTGHFVSFSSIYGLGTEGSVEKRGAFYEGRGPLSPPPPPSFSLPPPPFPFSSSSSLFPRQRSSNFDKMQNWLYYHTQGERRRSRGGGEKKDVHFFTHVADREKIFVSC